MTVYQQLELSNEMEVAARVMDGRFEIHSKVIDIPAMLITEDEKQADLIYDRGHLIRQRSSQPCHPYRA